MKKPKAKTVIITLIISTILAGLLFLGYSLLKETTTILDDNELKTLEGEKIDEATGNKPPTTNKSEGETSKESEEVDKAVKKAKKEHEDYLKSIDVEKELEKPKEAPTFTDEEMEAKEAVSNKYQDLYSDEKREKPAPTMYKRLNVALSEAHDINWEYAYLTKGQLIWWLENEVANKVPTTKIRLDLDLKNEVVYVKYPEKSVGLISPYRADLDYYITNMISASAFRTPQNTIYVKFEAE